jgi:hypothetical protein
MACYVSLKTKGGGEIREKWSKFVQSILDACMKMSQWNLLFCTINIC